MYALRMINEIGRLIKDEYMIWMQIEVPTMKEKIYESGRVWSETEKDLFFSHLRADLERNRW